MLAQPRTRLVSLSALLPDAIRDADDEHELKLSVEPGTPIAAAVERIERRAAVGDAAAFERIAGQLRETLGLERGSAVEAISHIDRFSVYHDTPALDLYRSSASFRTRRRRNGKFHVNAKRPDARDAVRGCLLRREWRYSLDPEVFEFVEKARFRPLLEHHFADLVERQSDAALRLAPVLQIHKRSTRIELRGPGGARFLLSLDRFRGFDCRETESNGATRELREVELEARNGKASRALSGLRDRLCPRPGLAPGGTKYESLVEELGIYSSIGSSRCRS